jgi:hypothetical protein
LIDKFDATRIPASPHYPAMVCSYEAIQGQVKPEGGRVMGVGVKHGSAIVDIQHPAGMTAANAVNVEQRLLADFNAFQGTTFKHGTSPKSRIIGELINAE